MTKAALVSENTYLRERIVKLQAELTAEKAAQTARRIVAETSLLEARVKLVNSLGQGFDALAKAGSFAIAKEVM